MKSEAEPPTAGVFLGATMSSAKRIQTTSKDLPPIIAYHAVFSTYGFWLPNDERGSWSKNVWSPRLKRFGPPVSPGTTRSVAGRSFDRARRDAAREELARPHVRFTLPQLAVIGRAVGRVASEYRLPIYAAAFMRDHVHLVFARRAMKSETWVGYFKRAASRELRKAGLHPFQELVSDDGRIPTPWAVGGWNVFLHDIDEILRTIRYVEKNPTEAGLSPQRWDYVVPFMPPRGRGG